jgi:hypothetical protein
MMTTALDVPPTSSVVLRSALDVCAFVDDLPSEEATGQLVFVGRGGSKEGLVLVEDGRVCWVAACGLSRRLTDLLAASAHLDATKMEALYVACAAQQRPLGEYLVSQGVVTADDLRGALLRHTTESLLALTDRPARVEWRAKPQGGYSPRFTFTTNELLARTYAEAHRAVARQAEGELAEAFADGDWGAAFLRSSASAVPEPIAIEGPCPEKIQGLLALGAWASSSLDVAECLQDGPVFLATMLCQGAIVAWRSGETVIVGLTRAHGPARLLNRRARARRSGELDGRL